jgi:hypothetical protein
MARQLKKPWVAALLNFILPGLGYVYSRKRVAFGIGLLLSSIILYWGISFSDLPPVVWIDAFVLAILFAYDGYKTTEEINLGK